MRVKPFTTKIENQESNISYNPLVFSRANEFVSNVTRRYTQKNPGIELRVVSKMSDAANLKTILPKHNHHIVPSAQKSALLV
jgi:hypothetical protein